MRQPIEPDFSTIAPDGVFELSYHMMKFSAPARELRRFALEAGRQECIDGQKWAQVPRGRMAIEIERRFLVKSDDWRSRAGPGRRFCQGYIARSGGTTVRVRRADRIAYVTIKGQRDGITRPEYEYEIPVDDAEEILANICIQPLLEKTRYQVCEHGHTWVIDVFQNGAEGLILAEVELDRADQPIKKPDWVGEEITHDLRYRNATIAGHRPRGA